MVFSRWRVRLIDNIADAAGFGSIWASVLGIAFSLLEVVLTYHHMMPSFIREILPSSSPAFAVLFGLVILARIFKIERIEDDK